jgi:hypothetical protein
MNDTPSIKQILIDFIYIREQLKILFKDKIEYQPIVDFLLAKDYLDDDLEIPFPRMKDIEEAKGLKSHMLRKLLLQMHNHIFGFSNNLKLSFSKVLYHFTINYYGKNCYFILDKLEHLPRVGENISLPFVKAITNINWFYVEEIQHEFQDTTQNIHITLKVGSYNSFWHFRKDQAIELNEVGFRDSLDLSDSQLKKKIYSNNHWHRYR